VPAKPRVLVDADVVLAACASSSEHGASLVTLRLAEATLIEAITCEQVITEVRRNVAVRLPKAQPMLETILGRTLRVVPDPTAAQLAQYAGLAHEGDLPILVAAVMENCQWLVTFHVRHYQPGCPGVALVQPGEFVLHVRDVLSRLGERQSR